MQGQVLWQKTLDVLEQRLSKASYGTFVAPLQPLDLTGNELTLVAPNEFTLNWVTERHRSLIEAALTEVAGHQVTVCVQVTRECSKVELAEQVPIRFPPSHKIEKDLAPRAPRASGLNPRWTFETLVVGHNNRFAHAAGLAVAQEPGVYNPLFLHGGVGLGKSHLMHAVGHYVRQHQPQYRVIYIRAEKFTTEMAMAYKEGRGLEFQNRFRQADLLLVDDIQFMANKERTQEEFFHTFNTLYDSGKQIILSSDRPPKEIFNLEERLRSRFESGLLADISIPDMETRVTILKKQAAVDGLGAPDDMVEFIAGAFPTNVRELVGAFIRVMAFASLQGEPLTIPTAQRALKGTSERAYGIDSIIAVVARHYGIGVDEMVGQKRTQTIAFARQIAMYLSRELTDFSFPQIGIAFGGRHHSTPHHAYDKVNALVRSQASFKDELEQIMGKIRAGM